MITMTPRLIPTALLALAVTLTGCAVPGVQLKTSGQQVTQPHDAATFDINQHVEIFPITPALLATQYRPEVLPRANPGLASSLQAYDYRVGPGDVLNIVVWGHPEINRAVGQAPMTNATSLMGGLDGQQQNTSSGTVVDAQGYIFYPYAGRVRVSGKSASQIRAQLTGLLGRYLRYPQVDVTIAAYQHKKVQVTGAVERPSQLAITNVPMTVLNAVNLAGGLADNADPTRATLTRNGHTRTISLYDIMQHGDMSQNVLLGPNDVLFIPTNEKRRIHVMGEVIEQKTLAVPPSGLSLTAALGEAKGISQTLADARGVFVIRPRDPAATHKIADIYQLNLKDASAFAMGTRFQLQPEDIVFVTLAPVGRWNRVVSQVIPSLTTFGLLANAFNLGD